MDAKANVDAKNLRGETPLHFAAAYGHKACVQVTTLCIQFFHRLPLYGRSSSFPALKLTS